MRFHWGLTDRVPSRTLLPYDIGTVIYTPLYMLNTTCLIYDHEIEAIFLFAKVVRSPVPFTGSLLFSISIHYYLIFSEQP